jgi:hypothetical protein
MITFIVLVIAFILFVGGAYLLGVNRNRKTAKAELEQLEAHLEQHVGDAKKAVLLWIARQREKLGV